MLHDKTGPDAAIAPLAEPLTGRWFRPMADITGKTREKPAARRAVQVLRQSARWS